jgi:hypothetical protein
MVDTESGEASPMVSYFEFNDSNGVFQLNQYFSGSGAVNSLGWGGRSFVTATAAVVYQAILPYYSSSAIQVATAVNAITGKAPDFPVYLYCSTAGQNWKRGRIPDISTLPNVIGANKVEPSSGPPFGSLCVGNPSSGQGYVAMPWPGMAAGPSW